MRKILFRGKRTDNGEWVEGCLVYDSQHTCIKDFGLEYFEVIPETVGEFTGLTDKNGKKIFEGDIGKFILKSTKQVWHLEVCIGEHGDCYGCVFLKLSENASFNGRLIKDDNFEFEVIGNIFDNPELLK